MSKQEILSWASVATSVSVIFFYVLFVFGWPDFLPGDSARFTKIFFNLFWIGVIVEFIVEISESIKKSVKDERDKLIEYRGYKYSYSFLSVAVIIVLVQLFLSNLFGEQAGTFFVIGQAQMVFHVLFIVLFTSSVIKRSTMIYHYRKGY